MSQVYVKSKGLERSQFSKYNNFLYYECDAAKFLLFVKEFRIFSNLMQSNQMFSGRLDIKL